MSVRKIERILMAGMSLTLALSLAVDSIQAQVPGSLNLQEKRPTTRDPRYAPPLAPPALQKKADQAAESGIILNPMSDADMGKFLQSRQRQNEKLRQKQEFLLEQELSTTPGNTERVHLERSVLRQFGTDDFPYEWRAPHEYTETAYRRFEIVFFLALPITMIASYALVSAGKQYQHESHVFNGPQTAGMVALGTGSALGIAWYDHVQWNRSRAVGAALEDRDRQIWDASRASGAHRTALDKIALSPQNGVDKAGRSGGALPEDRWQMGMNFHF